MGTPLANPKTPGEFNIPRRLIFMLSDALQPLVPFQATRLLLIAAVKPTLRKTRPF